MEPSYPDGADVTAGRWRTHRCLLRRGDVVVMRSPAGRDRLELKRIVGLPFEEVSWTGGRLWINGRVLHEPYARIPPLPPGDDDRHSRRLGPDEYFTVGDNRLHSTDSRSYGPVPLSLISGKVLAPR